MPLEALLARAGKYVVGYLRTDSEVPVDITILLQSVFPKSQCLGSESETSHHEPGNRKIGRMITPWRRVLQMARHLNDNRVRIYRDVGYRS